MSERESGKSNTNNMFVRNWVPDPTNHWMAPKELTFQRARLVARL
jgi:hypothetical protein